MPDPSPASTPSRESGDDYWRSRAQQSLPIAIIAGSGAALAGAALWALITVLTEYQIGWMAIGVGFLVGFAVRMGRGVDKIFGITGAILSLLGCVLGNFLSLIGFISKQQNTNFLSALTSIDYTKVPQLMSGTFSVRNLVFYGIAVYEGYRFSFDRTPPVVGKTVAKP